MLGPLQPYAPFIIGALGLLMLYPEIKKALGWVAGASGKVSLPVFTPSSTPTLVEATQAAHTLQQHYACRCNEAQAKLQVALTHFYDPIVKPPVLPTVDPAIAAQVTQILAARPQE
jgi:hypothetical protein